MEKTIDRIRKIQAFYGLRTSEMERRIGYSKRGLANAAGSHASVRDEIIVNTLNEFPEINMEWLLLGKGPMLKGLNNKENKLGHVDGSTISKRIFMIAENYRLNQNRLAQILGFSEVAIGKLIRGENNPRYDMLVSILTNFPQVNPEWLMMGQGKMLKPDTPNTEGLEDKVRKIVNEVLNEREKREYKP